MARKRDGIRDLTSKKDYPVALWSDEVKLKEKQKRRKELGRKVGRTIPLILVVGILTVLAARQSSILPTVVQASMGPYRLTSRVVGVHSADDTTKVVRTKITKPAGNAVVLRTDTASVNTRAKYTEVRELTVIVPPLPAPLPRTTISYDSAIVLLDSPPSYWVVTKTTKTGFYLRDVLGTDIGPVPRKVAKVVLPTDKNYPCAVARFKGIELPECPKPK